MNDDETSTPPPSCGRAGPRRVTIAVGLISLVVGVLAPVGTIGALVRGPWANAGEVSAAPGPGSTAPVTQIAFRGVPTERLRVTGSKSGLYLGTLRSDLDGRGGRFLPDKPFTPGETVIVSSADRVRDATDGNFQFTVATSAREEVSSTPAFAS